jgi:hypothetical protein
MKSLEDTYQDFCTSKVTKLNLVGERINLQKKYILGSENKKDVLI